MRMLVLWRGLQALRTSCSGQDLIEYALLAGFVAVAVVTLSPQIATSFATIWSNVNSVAALAAAS
jgi:Flp pilus assembly pilin Flp